MCIDAQLTSSLQSGDAVCEGTQVVFSCHQAEYNIARWTVTVLSTPYSTVLLRTVTSANIGTPAVFGEILGFRLEIHVLATSSSNEIFSELRVITKRQLNGAMVSCTGVSGRFDSTINVAFIGESIL